MLNFHSFAGGGSGLSAGAIIGILLGVAIVLFIVVPFVYAYGRECWRQGQLRGWWNRQRQRMRTWTENLSFTKVRSRSLPVVHMKTEVEADASTSVDSTYMLYCDDMNNK